tara:strand:+ start:1677 stop:2159 length:483 start_codon:yes stop_codon:yes gene_type:complete
MKTCLKESLKKVPQHWKSASKIYGEACEYWVSDQYCCPLCGGALLKLAANTPIIDHVCRGCDAKFQVKSSKKPFVANSEGNIKILGAEYNKTLEAISEYHVILVEYDKINLKVNQVGTILKNNVTSKNVIPRNPLGPNARRAGWQGCTLIFDSNVISFSF